MSMKIETKSRLELQGPLALIRLEGDITSASKQAVLGVYETLPEGTESLLIDFQKVGYLNSSGIALIIQLLMDAAKRNRRVRVFGLSAHFQKVFSMLGLSNYMAIDPDEATARQGLGNSAVA